MESHAGRGSCTYRLIVSRYLFLLLIPFLAGCESLFGSKSDDTLDAIFREGRIDPTAVDVVGYVPVQPFFQEGFGGRFEAPKDIYVGYDGFLYVVDNRGLHILDLSGRPQALISQVNGQPLKDATNVIQDRRLQIYVTARRDTTVEGRLRTLPVVYRFSGVTEGQPRLEHTIWHPFSDRNRSIVLRNPQDFDEQVRFTGVAVRFDNQIYVSRSGPNISALPTSLNTVMEFTAAGVNTSSITSLSGTRPSLTSSVFPTAVLTTVHPPQRTSFPASLDFFVAQSPYPPGTEPANRLTQAEIPYSVLSIRVQNTADGLLYTPNANFLGAAQVRDTTRGKRYLYDLFRFTVPTGMTFAADGTNYLFVIDGAKDSLFVFNAAGIEGVAPPPGSRDPRPVIVSFGGRGDNLLRFNNPQGVAYNNRIVYVADTGNNRISRFRLNTDFE